MMQCFIVFLSVFLLINTIGAPPVVEKPAKDKGTNESKTDNTDDEVVRREHFLVTIDGIFVLAE